MLNFKFKETFDTLVTKEVNLNLQDDSGYTAVYQAVLENNYDAVLYMVKLKNVNFNVSFSNFFVYIVRMFFISWAPTFLQEYKSGDLKVRNKASSCWRKRIRKQPRAQFPQ